MRKLFWKIFIPILLAMVAVILVSILLAANSSMKQGQEIQENLPQLYEAIKDVALQDGEAGVKAWLQENTDSLSGLDIYIVPRGENIDLLGRRLPPRRQVVDSIGRRLAEQGGRRNDGPPPRRRRGFAPDRYPNLEDSDGNRYRITVTREPRTLKNLVRNQRAFWPILLSMILISGLVSALIARHISRPVKRLRLGAQRIAEGNLQERVSAKFHERKDEIGDLARDFDVMAEHVDDLLQTQQNLLRDVSHELRSPLARIQVALGLAEKRGGETIKPELERIETEANILNEMIGKILSLVRLQKLSVAQSSLKWEENDLVTLLQSLVNNANYEAQRKGVSVVLTGLQSAPFKMAPELLMSGLENVIRNAVQYSPDNGEVRVSITKTEARKYLITISDAGPGVPEEAIDKLFEPFYRVSQVREHNKGTGGIGLAIAKQAIELHAGKITALNSDPGLLVEIRLDS